MKHGDLSVAEDVLCSFWRRASLKIQGHMDREIDGLTRIKRFRTVTRFWTIDAGDKCFIHGPKHHRENQLPSLEPPYILPLVKYVHPKKRGS